MGKAGNFQLKLENGDFKRAASYIVGIAGASLLCMKLEAASPARSRAWHSKFITSGNAILGRACSARRID